VVQGSNRGGGGDKKKVTWKPPFQEETLEKNVNGKGSVAVNGGGKSGPTNQLPMTEGGKEKGPTRPVFKTQKGIDQGNLKKKKGKGWENHTSWCKRKGGVFTRKLTTDTQGGEKGGGSMGP